MEWFLRVPCLEAGLAGLAGLGRAGVEELLLVMGRGAGVWEGEDVGCEGEEEEEEGLWEMHGCFCYCCC